MSLSVKEVAWKKCVESAIDDYISTHTLDDSAKAVISRLTADPIYTEAFSNIAACSNVPPSFLVMNCIIADEMRRKSGRLIADAEVELMRLAEFDRSVDQLTEFLRTATTPPSDSLSAYVSIDPQDYRNAAAGLSVIRSLINGRRRVCNETPLRMGVTNKKNIGKTYNSSENQAVTYDPGITRACGWLAAGVRKNCGRPLTADVAVLASALFEAEISATMVREAERTLREKPFRA